MTPGGDIKTQERKGDPVRHTLSIAFWYLPSDSTKTGYATEGALSICVQLSTDLNT